MKMANWYREVLGFEVKFVAEDSEKAVAFVTNADNKAMVELGKFLMCQSYETKSSTICNSRSLSRTKIHI